MYVCILHIQVYMYLCVCVYIYIYIYALSKEEKYYNKLQKNILQWFTLPEKSHGQRSLAGYSPWGHKELYMT